MPKWGALLYLYVLYLCAVSVPPPPHARCQQGSPLLRPPTALSCPPPLLPHHRPRHPYPDEHREQAPAARGQVDVGVQEVLVDKGVGEEGEPRQD